jgi:hypothetical protein
LRQQCSYALDVALGQRALQFLCGVRLLNARSTNSEFLSSGGSAHGLHFWKPSPRRHSSLATARHELGADVTHNPLLPISPLESVREGMDGVDARGRRLGTVVGVRLGYPQAVATDADQPDLGPVRVVVGPEGPGGSTSYGVATPFLIAQVEPEMSDELRLELLRAGNIEVDGPEVRGLARQSMAIKSPRSLTTSCACVRRRNC